MSPWGAQSAQPRCPQSWGRVWGGGWGAVLANALNRLESHPGGGSCHGTSRCPIGRGRWTGLWESPPLPAGAVPTWGRTRLIPGESGVTAAAPETAGSRLPLGTLARGSTPRLCHWWKVSWAGAGCPLPLGLALSTPIPVQGMHRAPGYGAANPQEPLLPSPYILLLAEERRPGEGWGWAVPAPGGLWHKSAAEGAFPELESGSCVCAGDTEPCATCVWWGGGLGRRSWPTHGSRTLQPGCSQQPAPLTPAHAVPALPAGCPEPVREDVFSHPRGVPGGAAQAHDRLGAHRLQTLGLQGAAAAQRLR